MASNEKQNPGVPPSFIYSRSTRVRLIEDPGRDPHIICDKDVLNQSSTLPLHLKCLLFKANQEGHPESIELCYHVPDEEPIIPIRNMQRFVDKYVKKSYDPGVDEEHKKLIGRMPAATSKAIPGQGLIRRDPGLNSIKETVDFLDSNNNDAAADTKTIKETIDIDFDIITLLLELEI